MKTLDIHTIWDSPIVGYGRAYCTIRDELARLCSKSDNLKLAETYTGGSVQLFVGAPLNENAEHFERKSDRFICLTMWESTKIPASVIDNLSKFDEIIVPSEWGKTNLIENGITIPIHVIPLGIKVEDWPFQKRIREPGDKFTIIWQGSYFGDRKGGQDVVEAFKSLNLPNAELILKLNPKCTQAKIEWDLPHCLDYNIRSIGKVFDQGQMLELLSFADLSVYSSYGEGFGLIPLEHMATGLPVILSDNTAMSQYCDNQFNIPIPCIPKAATYGELVGIDYIPLRDKLEIAVKFAYDNRDYIRELGEDASRWVHHNWSITKTAKEIINLCLNGG
jgi:glycosyltransferase involved in cell wall biosynthesis